MVLQNVVEKIIIRLQQNVHSFVLPLIPQLIHEFGHNPYIILIGCLLSLRSRDSMTIHVCRDLFTRVQTPQAMVALPREELEHMVARLTYYRTKAAVLQHVSQVILRQFGGEVPNSYESLMTIKGIGPKTAALVMGMAFGEPHICVDTHVHRISNRLGIIKTRSVEESEKELEKIIPRQWWIKYNHWLVMWGQNVCVPISPRCSSCALNDLCKKIGVTSHR